MARHFIHYVTRTIRLRFKPCRSTPILSTNDFKRPSVHLTRAEHGVVGSIREGDVIWLVAQLRSPWGMLPPGIDARIEVGSIIRKGSETRFNAKCSSAWLPLRDATSQLQQVRFIGAGGESLLWTDHERPVGQYLQSMRELANGEVLEQWHAQMRTSGYDFVSYRQRDGTRKAFEYVKKLLEEQKLVFWDRWSLPRGIAERREYADGKHLDPYLNQAINAAERVWGICSLGYGAKESYSAREVRHAGDRLEMVKCQSLGYPCALPCLQRASADPTIGPA